LTLFALMSGPALGVTYFVDRKRLGLVKPSADQSSPFTVLALRLAPFYLWTGILTSQAHKEERFMFPAYPLLCFNAAVTLYLMRGWLETIFISITKSPYRVSCRLSSHVRCLPSPLGLSIDHIPHLHVLCHSSIRLHISLAHPCLDFLLSLSIIRRLCLSGGGIAPTSQCHRPAAHPPSWHTGRGYSAH
jgi:hypothetical protein